MRDLVERGRSSTTGDGGEERSGRHRRAHRPERLRAVLVDERQVGQRLDVADHRRQPGHPSKGRGGLSVGLACPPLMRRTAAVSSPATYPGSTVTTLTSVPPNVSGGSWLSAVLTRAARASETYT
ncbi:hypothetical protein [Mycolicibacterium celeriflavum]|uniref:hypothetical protein n=1 Tax=Mycolicibacterium celeriflavum TaxID=1249101 RepID=UPI001FD4768B|nr:hypothetical protein [Mycolicibacterium celeriflavum]